MELQAPWQSPKCRFVRSSAQQLIRASAPCAGAAARLGLLSPLWGSLWIPHHLLSAHCTLPWRTSQPAAGAALNSDSEQGPQKKCCLWELHSSWNQCLVSQVHDSKQRKAIQEHLKLGTDETTAQLRGTLSIWVLLISLIK